MYCKLLSKKDKSKIVIVFIVAKCIVNSIKLNGNTTISGSINSSKVYCKYGFDVDFNIETAGINSSKVYCKYIKKDYTYKDVLSINSSKVYCKYKLGVSESLISRY